MEASSPSRFARARTALARRADPIVIEGTIVVLLALGLLLYSSHLRSTSYNNYIRVADAVRHGHLWIDYPGAWLDAVRYNGQHYGVDAPFPALLCLPFVLLWGASTNQTLIVIAVAVFGMFLAWRLLVRFGVARIPRGFLVLFIFAGTDFWWCAELGDVWYFAHVAAVTATLLLFHELIGRRRGWAIALCAVAAIESRNTMLLCIPFTLAMFWTGDLARAAAAGRGDERELPRVDEPRGLVSMGVVYACFAIAWVALNEAMWGTVLDIGHTVYYHQDAWGSPIGSPFGVRYLPYQLYSFFVRGPEFMQYLQVPMWPYLKVDPNGLALTFTSPAYVLAFLARRPVRVVRYLWITAGLVAVPSFLYYLNGWYQFGMRHALDFMPFLFLLMALGCRERIPRWGAALIVYSALVGTWGVWWWGAFMRTGD